MADYLAYDAAYTARRIQEMLAAYPELMDDADLRADMIDGETDFPRVMSRLVRAQQERIALASGVAEYIGALSERKARMERGANGIKETMLDLMQAAGADKVTLPEATISVTKPRTTVEIVDGAEAHLPQGFVTFKPIPDKTALKSALEAGEDIPGARLVTGDPGLTIRTR
jgi:hypothetical protein